MPDAKHQPPSRRRYAATHPTIGVHCVDQKMYDDLIALRERSGLSLGQLVLQALGKVAMDVAKVEFVGRARGYWQAKARYCLTTPCSGCGQPLEILPGSELADEAVRAVRAWGHIECIRDAASRR
jgi:hypothetical protein